MSQQPKKKQSKQPKKAKQSKQPEKKPLGDMIEWSDEDLDALSLITEADLKAADALWKSGAPPKLKNLLQADILEEKQ